MTKLLGVVGIALLAVAVLLGFRMVSTAGTECGSVFQPLGGITPMACDTRIADRGNLVAMVAGAGMVALIASAVLTKVRNRREDGH